MCPSMADSDFYTKKPTQKPPISEIPTTTNHTNNNNPSKYFNNKFLYKAIITTVFLVIIPFLPSQVPEFINQNFHPRSWELLQLIFVGIAVSYGLFSKRNDEFFSSDNVKENYNCNNAQSYVSRLLQVSYVFDDHEIENPSSPIFEENKVQTWKSKYYREEPKSILEKQNEKPLFLPVRSLKSRVFEQNQGESTETLQEFSVNIESFCRSNSNFESNRFAGNSRNWEKIEENVVHRSPIPWRSRSGRLEMKGDEESLSQPPKMEEFDPIRLQSLMKSKSRIVPNDLSENEHSNEIPFLEESVRTIRQSEAVLNSAKTREEFGDKLMLLKSLNLKPEKMLVETDDSEEGTESEDEDEDYFEQVLGNSGTEEETVGTNDEGGPDVDKKADEFIAKFREQIRLQRIESIRRSARQLARNPVR